MPELTAPIVYKNDEKRIVFGPVLIPDEADSDGDVVSEEKIEEVAHKFVEDYGNIDLQHSLNNVGNLVESYILPIDIDVGEGNLVPKGSWMMGVRVSDDDAWEAIKDSKLTGFSIMALQKTAMKSAEKSDSKRITLADLGDDWIVNAVSLVDEPAVPKAKWLAIKSKKDAPEPDATAVEKAIAGSLEHRRQLVNEELDEQFSGIGRYAYLYSTMNDSVVFRLHLEDDGESKYYQVDYEIGEDGKVVFTDQPQEVEIEESVVEVQNMIPSVQYQQEEPEEKTIMQKFAEGLGFKPAQKAGKIISNKNYEKLKKAQEAIDDIIQVAEKERANKSAEGGKEDMDKEEVQELIDQALKSYEDKFKNPNQDEETEIILETEDDEEAKLKREEELQEEQQEHPDSEEDLHEEGDEVDDLDAYKQKYEEVLEQLQAVKNKPFSNRLSGQDGAEKSAEEEVKPERDAFGYKTK